MVAGLFLATVSSTNLTAQEVKVKSEMKETKKYVCPHHPDQLSDKPGKCTVCGMDLVEMKSVKYACPHHPDKMSDKPGKCECGMDLVEVKDMKMNHEKMKMNGDPKKLDMGKMKEDSKKMKMEMKDSKMDSSKMMKEKM